LPTSAITFCSSQMKTVAFFWQRTPKALSLDADIQAVCQDRGTECEVRLSGRITIDSSPSLRALLLRRLESRSCQVLTLELGELVYLDTSGLAVLVEILRSARNQAKEFHLTGLQERPRYLLETTRLLRLFDKAASETPRRNT
jgi:anti-sigma B factor antagonist